MVLVKVEQLSFFTNPITQIVSPHNSTQDLSMIADVKSRWSESTLNDAVSGVYVFFDNYYVKVKQSHPSVSECTIYRCIDKALSILWFEHNLTYKSLNIILTNVLECDKFRCKTLVNATSRYIIEDILKRLDVKK